MSRAEIGVLTPIISAICTRLAVRGIGTRCRYKSLAKEEMTERQALKLSGLHDEVRKKAIDMGFTAEQVETALIVTGGKTFKAVVDFLLKVPRSHRVRTRLESKVLWSVSGLGTVLARVAVRVRIPFPSRMGFAVPLAPSTLPCAMITAPVTSGGGHGRG